MTANPPPGWYPDPADQFIARWWDGQGWTADVRPAGPPSTASGVPQVAAPQPVPPPQSDRSADEVVQRKKRYPYEGIYADGEGIRCQSRRDTYIRWDDAEWFGHSITHRSIQNTLFYAVKIGRPQPVGSSLVFAVGIGEHRKQNLRQIVLLFSTNTHHDTNEHWEGLVRLCHKHLEPRLQGSILSRLRAGERINMGGFYDVDRNGIYDLRRGRFYPWDTSRMSVDNGIIFVEPPGGTQQRKDTMALRSNYPNAQLLPYLQAKLTGRT